MGGTLDEWIEKNAEDLKDNLEANISQFKNKLTEEDAESLMRLNFIMIRSWAQDRGIK